MRFEIYFIACILGIVAIDMSANYKVLFTQDDELRDVVLNSKIFFDYGTTPPRGIGNNLVPFFVISLISVGLYRVISERKIIDISSFVLLVATIHQFLTIMFPLEEGLKNIDNSNIGDLKYNMTTIFLGHVCLLFVLLTGIVCHLIAQHPKSCCRIEIIPIAIYIGVYANFLTFDLPIVLEENLDLTPAFVSNTMHLDSFLNGYMRDSFFGFVTIMLLFRLYKNHYILDLFSLLCLAAILIINTQIEPKMKTMKQSGVISINALTTVAQGHITITILLLLIIIINIYISKRELLQ